MSQVTSDRTAELNAPLTGTCGAQWRLGIFCPNAAVEIAVCTNEPGYLPMCELHAAHFKAAYPEATVRWLTPIAFDAERAKGLYAGVVLP